MADTHQHVKVIGSVLSHSRSLLVTQSAGISSALPLALDEVLGRPPEQVAASIPGMAAAVAVQVGAFGTSTPDQTPVGRLLWPSHSRDRIAAQWKRRGGEAALAALGADGADPVAVFDRLMGSKSFVRFERQEARHGDLNFSNVAIEEAAEGQLNAWVFDAAGGGDGANGRDLATLEITTLLHQSPCATGPVVEQCRGLFTGSVAAGRDYGSMPADPRARNTRSLIEALRGEALKRTTPDVYAVLLFDEALMQLEGLDYGSSHNKICHPPDSAYLAGLVAGLVLRNVPHLAAADA